MRAYPTVLEVSITNFSSMQKSPKFIGLLQALGLLSYISLFAFTVRTLSTFVHPFFDEQNSVLPIMIPLLTFVTSALICSTIAFAYPVRLFIQDKKDAALRVILWTTLWLLVIGLVFLVFVIVIAENT